MIGVNLQSIAMSQCFPADCNAFAEPLFMMLNETFSQMRDNFEPLEQLSLQTV
jgi:hypothetical protein